MIELKSSDFEEGQEPIIKLDASDFEDGISTVLSIPSPIQPSYAAPIETADFYTTMKAERMGLIKPSGIEDRLAQASVQAATEKRRRERRDIIAKLQSDVDRGINLDPDLVVEYGADLKFPEMEEPKAVKPTVAKEPIQPEVQFAPSNIIGDVARTVASLSMGVGEAGLSAVKGITDLSESIPVPQFIRNTRNKIAAVTGMDKLSSKLNSLISEVGMYRNQIKDEIVKESGGGKMGIAAKVVSDIADGAAVTALTLAGLGATGFVGKGATIRHAIAEAAKFGGFTYVTTPGTQEERLEAAAHSTAFMLTPIPAAKMPTSFLAKAVNIAENIGINTPIYIDAVKQAKANAAAKGTPDEWVKELVATATPILVNDVIFGMAVQSKKAVLGKENKAIVDSLIANAPKEFLTPVTKGFLTPEQLAAQPKIEEMPIEQPVRIELPKKEVADAIQKPIPAEVDVGAPPKDGAEVGRTYAEGEGITREVVAPPQGKVAEIAPEVATMPVEPSKPIREGSRAVETTEAVGKGAKAQTLQERMAEVTGQDQTFLDWIRTDLKGIRKGTDISEEMYGYKGRGGPIDISLRPQRGEQGTKLDDAAEQAFGKGFITEPDSRLFLEKIESSRRAEQRLPIEEKAAQEQLQGEIEKAEAWGETQSKLKQSGKGEEANPHIMDVNGTFSINGEKHKVIAEGKDGIKVMDGESFWITFTRPEAETARIFIDKNSYKPPEEAPVKKPATGELLPAEDLQLVGGKAVSDVEQARRDVVEAKRAESAKQTKLEEQARDLFAKPSEPAAQVSDKDLIIKPLSDLKSTAELHGIKTEGMDRKSVVDEIKTKQNEIRTDKLVEEMPIPAEAKRKRGLKNRLGAIGFEKPLRASIPTPSGDAAKVEIMFGKQRADVESKFRLTIDKMRDKISSALFGSDVPITRRLFNNNGKKVVIAKVLSRGWGSRAERDFNEAENNIKDTIPHRLDRLFDDFIQAKRTIEVSNLMREQRGKQSELFAEGELPEVIKSPGGLGAKSNREWLDEIRRQYPQEYKQMEVAHEKWKVTMRKQIDKLLNAGLIDKTTHDYLAENHQNFSPRKFIQHIDPTVEVLSGGKKITVRDSGIESLDTGSEQSLLNNSSYLLAQTISGVEARIAKNKANKALLDYVKENPKNELGLKWESEAEASKPITAGNTRVSVMIDGKPQSVTGSSELMQYWIDSDPQIKYGTLKVLQIASGTKLVKALATGYNPEFALSNIARDMAHYAMVTQEYSPVLPIAWVQQIKDIATVLPDTIHRRGRVNDFIDDGGSMEYLSTQGQIGKKPGKYGSIHNEAVKQVSNFAGWLGQTSEILTRLALRERALKNGKSREEASYIARQAIDFAQGGTLVKTVDNFVPYLNAGFQGTRGIMDAIKTNPITTSLKIAQVIAFQTALSMWAKKTLEEEYDSISDADKVSKFCIPTPFFAKDKNGNKRYYYLAIPKDQGQQIFSALGNEIAEKTSKGKPSFQRIKMALENAMPADVQTLLPPTLSATLGYLSNKDFWQNEDIWKGRQVDPEFEKYATTPAAWVKAGQVTGMSPERLQRSFSKIVPNNPFVFIMGGLQGPMVASSDDSTLEQVGTVVSKLPIIRRYLRITRPVELREDDVKDAEKYNIPLYYDDKRPRPRIKIKEEIEDAVKKNNNIRQINDVYMDVLMGKIKRKETTLSEYEKWVGKVSGDNADEFKRLNARLIHKYSWALGKQ